MHHRLLTLLWLSVCLWASMATASAAPQVAEAAPVTLTGREQARELDGVIDRLEDPTGQRSVDQIRRVTAGWVHKPGASLNLGISTSVWWLRLRLHNPGAADVDTVLDLQQPLQDFVEWFVVGADGRLRARARSGDRLRFDERPVQTRGLVMPIHVAAGEQVEVFMRLSTHDGLFETLRPTLDTPQAFVRRVERNNVAQGLYFGVLLTLAGYNLCMFLSLRERVFGLYVAYLAAFTLWAGTFRGLGLEYLWPEHPDFNNQILAVGAAASLACSMLFAIGYLRLNERAAKPLVNAGLALAAIEAAFAGVAWADHYALTWILLLPVGVLTMAFNAGLGLWQWRRGSREGMFYSLAFVPLSVGVLLNILQLVGLLPADTLTENAWQFAALFEVTLLAWGLADSVHQMKAAKLAAEQTARRANEALTGQLELQVRERTAALETANRKLQVLAIVDELTGAFNRRHFNEVCRARLAIQPRAEAMAMCMFDIDHFKRYNDHYGHQAGDRALAAVSQTVDNQLKRTGDFLFRLGGEEFGVLMSASDAASAAQFAEHLRLSVQALAIPHAGNNAGVVTASFGAVWWSAAAMQGLSPEAIYLAADRRLYEAKAAGRNRVSFAAVHAGPAARPATAALMSQPDGAA
jgi:diguanylate cyclase